MGAVLQWDARVYVGLRTGTFSLGSFTSKTEKALTPEIIHLKIFERQEGIWFTMES